MPKTGRLVHCSFVVALSLTAACQSSSPSPSTTAPAAPTPGPEDPSKMATRTVPELRALLRNAEVLVRINATEELGHRAATSGPAVEALVEACANEEPLVRRFAAGGLAEVPSPNAATIGALTRLLKDPEADPRQSATRTLAALGPRIPDGAVADLAAKLLPVAGDTDENTRSFGILAIGSLGPRGARAVPAVLPTLGHALEDPSADVRGAAADAIGKLGAGVKGTVALLEKALGDSVHDVRKMAVIALEKMGPAAAPATKGLVRQLRGKEIYLRVFAADALTAIGPGAKAALPELRAMVARGWKELDGSPEIEAGQLPEAVARAIRSLEGKGPGKAATITK